MKTPTQATQLLALSLSGATPSEAVEQIEREGQKREATTQRLPVDNKHHEGYESLGFTFGDKIDDLWQEATFPPGWAKKPTDHAMYTDIVDEQGNRRGSYFYKAACYDRSASMWPPLTRYQITADFEAEQRDRAGGVNNCVVIVLDRKSGAELYRERVTLGPNGARGDWSREDWTRSDEVQAGAFKSAGAWLAEKFPGSKDPCAYWAD